MDISELSQISANVLVVFSMQSAEWPFETWLVSGSVLYHELIVVLRGVISAPYYADYSAILTTIVKRICAKGKSTGKGGSEGHVHWSFL